MSFIRIARSAAPLLAIGFLADAAFVFVYLVVLQSYLPEALGASSALGGACLAAYGLAKLIAQVAGGMLSDRVGTRRALIFGTAIFSVATVAVPPVAATPSNPVARTVMTLMASVDCTVANAFPA